MHICQRLKVNYDLPENLDMGTVHVTDKIVTEALGEEDFKDESDDESDEEGSDEETE